MPVAPAIVDALDDVSPKAGAVGYGGYTNDSAPVLRVRLGDAEAGQTLTVSGDRLANPSTVTVDAAAISQGYVEVPVSGLPEGWNQLTATLRRSDGVAIATSMAFALGVATAAPAAPTITAALDDVGASTGVLADGARTDDAAPAFRIFEEGLPPMPAGSPGHAPFGGVALFGGRIQLYENGQLIGDGSLGYDGVVSITPGALSAGEHVITAVAVDRAGNVSDPSTPFRITVVDDGRPASPSAPAASTTPTTGDDLLQAGAGYLNVYAGAGADTILGANANEVLRGDAGSDSIVGGTQFNDINGNQGDDSIVGRSLVGDWLLGGQGNDLIDASQSSGRNIINGNLGADQVTGGTGAETLRGGQGDDVILGGGGNDWLSGDLGLNTLTGGDGADLFHAFQGAGRDVVTDFHGSEGDRILVDRGGQATARADGLDTVIDISGQGRMILVGVNFTTFDSGWIVQA